MEADNNNDFDESNEFADELFRFLKTRERSSNEVFLFLIKKKNEADSLKMLTSLKKRGLVNDKRFSESKVLSRIKLYQHGRVKIRKELQDHKVDEKVIDDAIAIVDEDIWKENASKIAKKYLGTKKVTNKKIAINLANKLLRLGYEDDLSKGVVNELGVKWPSDFDE